MRWSLVLLVVACSGSERSPEEGEPGPPAVAPASPTTVDPTTTTPPAASDEELARALLAGDLAPEEVIPAVAWSGGWPVATGSDTWIFVHWYDGGSWELAGDFNGWIPEPMTQGAGFWWAEVALPSAAGVQYKFVGDGTDWIADPFARSYTYDDFGEISYVAPPVDSWRLDRWPAFAAADLEPRDVRVYVPAGSGPWPVLYAHDGQNLFAPDAIWGGWRLQDALATVEPALVVGIDNTPARFDEYTHVADDIGYGGLMGGRGDDYVALVHEHLRPHIEAAYGSTGLDGLLGSSLGGLISLYVADRYPGQYDFVACLSGTLGWGAYADAGEGGPTMEALYLAAGHRDTALYLDSGGDAGADGVCTDPDGDGSTEDDHDDADNYCVTRAFADAMSAEGYVWDADLWHWHEPGASHDEAAWADRVFRPLGLFLSLDD